MSEAPGKRSEGEAAAANGEAVAAGREGRGAAAAAAASAQSPPSVDAAAAAAAAPVCRSPSVSSPPPWSFQRRTSAGSVGSGSDADGSPYRQPANQATPREQRSHRRNWYVGCLLLLLVVASVLQLENPTVSLKKLGGGEGTATAVLRYSNSTGTSAVATTASSSSSVTDYLQTFRRHFSVATDPTKRQLVFVHVPKTGGISIENVAAKAGIAWGLCRFPRRAAPRLIVGGCPPFPPPPSSSSRAGGAARTIEYATWPRKKPGGIPPWWHTPRQYFPFMFTGGGGNQNNNNNTSSNANYADPYRNAELFAVVRDPYTRIVSEFHWKCSPIVRQCDKTRQHDPEYMNAFLQNLLSRHYDVELARQQRTKVPNYRVGATEPGLRDHFAPQYTFVVSSWTAASGQQFHVRMADHVLYFEQLEEHFRRLMQAYSLDGAVKLEEKFNSAAALAAKSKLKTSLTEIMQATNMTTTPANPPKVLGVEDLDNTTMRMLNLLYRDDLQPFGYATMTVPPA